MALTLRAYFTRPNWLSCQFVLASFFAAKERRESHVWQHQLVVNTFLVLVMDALNNSKDSLKKSEHT
jgi:hypothetical protein